MELMFTTEIQTLILSGLNHKRNKFYIGSICCCLFLTSCGIVSTEFEKNVSWEKAKIYEVKSCTIEGSCFFQYPYSATIGGEGGVMTISDDQCNVGFGLTIPDKKGTYEVEKSVTDYGYRESWTESGILVEYIIGFAENDYKFYLYDGGEEIAGCVDFVDQLAESFTDRPTYYNEKFSFTTAILSNFKVEYLPDNEGVVMKRTVSGVELKKIYDADLADWPSGAKEGPDEMPYEVEIGITAMENLIGYKDLGAYVKAECADCTLEFFGGGVFVGEDNLNFAERVFLAMSDDGHILYRAYLRLPRHRYKHHNKGFDEWVKTIEFF